MRRASCSLLIVVGTVLLAACADSSEPSNGQRGQPSSGSEGLNMGTPRQPGYPSAWEVEDVDSAKQMVTFPLSEPPAALLSSNEITHVYVWPDNVAVAIDFAPQTDGETRQDY